ncbi:beta strand repeat-containing protein, partial [Acinetobacter zhairhuonensis]
GNPVTVSKTVTTDASGHYSSAVTAADGIVDGSAVSVVANTTDRNGQGVGPATDSIAAQGDNDTDPTTPEDTGLDLVDGAITVDIVETGAITGTTTDVAPGTDVVLTITGTDANGNPVTVSKTVTTDASGHYSSAVTAADGIVDGSAVSVVANTTDRNGQGVGPATDSIAAQGDNDTDPTTPEDTGLDLVDGAITAEIDPKAGTVSGTVTDVPEGEKVIVTIEGVDKDGHPVKEDVETTVVDGKYTVDIPAAIVDGSPVEAEAKSTDNNGKPVTDTATLEGKTDHDNDPSTPDQGGLDRVDGAITAEIDPKAGTVSGTVTDVPEGEKVIVTIEGVDKDGHPVKEDVETIVVDGKYTVDIPAAIVDGSAVEAEAKSTDNNGKPVTDTATLEGKTDHDNDPNTPDQGGLDRVDGAITVDIVETGTITGTTTDVAPGTNVVLTITGTDANGNPVTVSKTVTTDASGHYSSAVTAADGIVDGSAVSVVANTTDRNGQGVGPATDSIAAQGDNDTDPTTPEDTGLDLVDGAITVDIVETGAITGTTTDVAPGTDVVLTITGTDANGNPVTVSKTVTTDASGHYSSAVTAADGIVDGSAVSVVANTTDRNGQGVGPATDSIAAQGDNDTDPTTPEDTGLDLVDGAITVDIVETGAITGTTTDVAPGTDVVLTITGTDANGNPVTVSKTVTTDASGHYSSAVTAADGIVDGSAVSVVANTTDRNGQGVGPATDSIAAQGDNDTDPTTPEDTGLDLVAGAITVDVQSNGNITGGTTDVEPGSDVTLTITGQDKDGNPLEREVTATVNADGNYTAEVPTDFADGDITVKAETVDRNGNPVDAEDSLLKTDHDNDPNTPDQGGLDRIDGSLEITEIDEEGIVKGQTTDVPIGSDVVLTFKDHNGDSINDLSTGAPLTVTTIVKSDGSYEVKLPEDLIGLTDKINVKADSLDNNGKPVTDNKDTAPAVAEVTTNGDDNLTGTSGNDVLAGDTGGLKTNFIAAHDYNVSIVLDLSGSMRTGQLTNPTTSFIDAAKTALKAFVQQMADHDGQINLQITSFGGSNITQSSNLTNIRINDIQNVDIEQLWSDIQALQADGNGTYPHHGFNNAYQWFSSSEIADAHANGYENQVYYLTDGNPSSTTQSGIQQIDNAFSNIVGIDGTKVFAVGIGDSVDLKYVTRYDNTNINGDLIAGTWSGGNYSTGAGSNTGTAQKITNTEKLIAYLIGGSENFVPADVGDDTVKGGAGDDILFGDAMNTNWITGLDSLLYPQYSGYSRLIAKLKADGSVGADGEPTQQQIYDFVKANYREFIAADAADPATKGGIDTIYGGSGDDIIIAGAGNDIVYGGSGNDIISTGRGDDTIMYDVLNAADATAGNGTDTWVDYQANDKIEFAADFFDGLLADQSNLGDYITVVNDGNGNAVIQVDRDGNAATHTMSDLLIVENQAGLDLQDLLANNQLVIG